MKRKPRPIHVTNFDFLEVFAGIVYHMHPYHHPDGMDEMLEVLDQFCWFKSKFDGIEDVCSFNVEDVRDFRKEFGQWMRDKSKAYRQLNISRRLRDLGVDDIDDERNQGYRFETAYDKRTDDSRYVDFVDLDALEQNIICRLEEIDLSNGGCSFCRHRESNSKCSNCYIKDMETKENHYEFGLEPD